MAIGAALASLPWGTIIENAPALANRAMALWRGSRATLDEPKATAASVVQLVADVQQLNVKLDQASGIIGELAQTNAALVAKLETQRQQLIAVWALVAVSLALAIFSAVRS